MYLTFWMGRRAKAPKPPSPPLNPPLNYNEENIFLQRVDSTRVDLEQTETSVSSPMSAYVRYSMFYFLYLDVYFIFSMLLLYMDYSLFYFLYLDVYFNFSILLLHTEFLYLDVYFYFFIFYCCTRSHPCASVKSEKIK